MPLGSLGFVFAVLFLVFPATISPGQEEETRANSIIAPLRDAVYDHTEDEEGFLNLYEETLNTIRESLEDGPMRLRGEALTHYYLGRFYQDIKTTETMVLYAADLRKGKFLSVRRFYTEREQAMAAYEKAAAAAKEFLKEQESAESHRLYGEILGQMLILGDVGDLLSIGGKARRHVDKAREEDPTHTKALIQEASRMAYSPAAYGGDPDGARELYREALRGGNADKEDMFNIYGGFGMASFMEGKDADAISWFHEASTVYPGNPFAAGMAEFLENPPGDE